MKGENYRRGNETTVKPQITDVKGQKNVICCWWIFITANIENKRKSFEEMKFLHLLMADFCYFWVRYGGVRLYEENVKNKDNVVTKENVK